MSGGLGYHWELFSPRQVALQDRRQMSSGARWIKTVRLRATVTILPPVSVFT